MRFDAQYAATITQHATRCACPAGHALLFNTASQRLGPGLVGAQLKGLPIGVSFELGSAQTRSWRTASSGFAELWHAIWIPYVLHSSAKPFEAVRQDRAWAEPSSRVFPSGYSHMTKTLSCGMQAYGRLLPGDRMSSWDTPDTALSWQNAASPLPASVCDSWLMPSGATASLIVRSCATCRTPWVVVNAPDPASAYDPTVMAYNRTTCKCTTSCWPLEQGANIPANYAAASGGQQYGYETTVMKSSMDGLTLKVNSTNIVNYAGFDSYGFNPYAAFGVFVVPSIPCVFTQGGTTGSSLSYLTPLRKRVAMFVGRAPTTLLTNGMNAYSPKCTGTAIAPYWVVTAAHCVAGTALTSSTYVAVGQANMTNGIDYWSAIELAIAHPRYDPVTFGNDIALVKLSIQVCTVGFVPMSSPLSWAPPRPGPGGRPRAASPSFGTLNGSHMVYRARRSRSRPSARTGSGRSPAQRGTPP